MLRRFEVTLQKPYDNFYDEFTVSDCATSLDIFRAAQEIAKELMLDCFDWDYTLDESAENGLFEVMVSVKYPDTVFNSDPMADNFLIPNEGYLFVVEETTPLNEIEKEAEEIAAEAMLSDIDWFYRMIDDED